LLAAKEEDTPLPPPSSSINFHFDGREGDRSFEIKQMGRHYGHSCPKERYGQKKHEIFKRV
jgi:hypothetical protein